MEVVAVAFGPEDIKPATWAIAKSLVDGNIQLYPRVKSVTQALVDHQRFVSEEDVTDTLEGLLIN